MSRTILALCLSVLLWPAPAAAAPALTSIAPAAASPGRTVIVGGGPFGPQARVLLGDRVITPVTVAEGEVTFTVPELPEGDYVLRVEEAGEVSSASFLFRVILPPPIIEALAPAQVDLCAVQEGLEVEVTGRHFQPGAQLLLDGAAIAHEKRETEEIVFNFPPLFGGSHEVQVVNPDGKRSLPRSLLVNSAPEILQVSQGANYVNYYQLIVEGKNFFYTSTLVVDGRPIRRTALRPTQSDSVEFVDCRTLIYNRYPYSHQLKPVTLQVVNPNGQESSVLSVSIP